VFDLSTIWASFWTDPTDDARLRGEVPLGSGWSLTGALYARRYALSERDDNHNDAWQGGGDLGALIRRGRYDGSLRARIEGGDLGARMGLDLSARYWLRPQVLRLDAMVSGHTVDDQLRPERSVASLGLVAAMLVRVGRLADLHFSFEDDVNRIVGHRLRATASITLRSPF
jgi:hypothetical protein